jgi:lipid A 4'-phosphatase
VAVVGLYLIVGVGVLTAAIFTFDPSIDLHVARYFTRQDVKDVLAQGHFFLEAVRWLNLQFTVVLLSLTAAAIGFKILRPRMKMIVPARISLFVILVFALGPGLLVNGLLKELWGRPRPRMVTEFGGPHDFMAWWDPTGACLKNCSFVSGEASSAFAALALAVLVPAPLRYAAIAAALAYGASVSFIRMAVGAHFLSDVLFAGVFTALIVWVLHGLFWRWKRTAVPDSVADQMVGDTSKTLAKAWSAGRRAIGKFWRGLTAAKPLESPRPLAVARTVQTAPSPAQQ